MPPKGAGVQAARSKAACAKPQDCALCGHPGDGDAWRGLGALRLCGFRTHPEPIAYHVACAGYSGVRFTSSAVYKSLQLCCQAAKHRACAVCGLPGASVLCCGGGGSCKQAFHFPCARVAAAAGGAVLFAENSTLVACPKHHAVIYATCDTGEQHFSGLWREGYGGWARALRDEALLGPLSRDGCPWVPLRPAAFPDAADHPVVAAVLSRARARGPALRGRPAPLLQLPPPPWGGEAGAAPGDARALARRSVAALRCLAVTGSLNAVHAAVDGEPLRAARRYMERRRAAAADAAVSAAGAGGAAVAQGLADMAHRILLTCSKIADKCGTRSAGAGSPGEPSDEGTEGPAAAATAPKKSPTKQAAGAKPAAAGRRAAGSKPAGAPGALAAGKAALAAAAAAAGEAVAPPGAEGSQGAGLLPAGEALVGDKRRIIATAEMHTGPIPKRMRSQVPLSGLDDVIAGAAAAAAAAAPVAPPEKPPAKAAAAKQARAVAVVAAAAEVVVSAAAAAVAPPLPAGSPTAKQRAASTTAAQNAAAAAGAGGPQAGPAKTAKPVAELASLGEAAAPRLGKAAPGDEVLDLEELPLAQRKKTPMAAAPPPPAAPGPRATAPATAGAGKASAAASKSRSASATAPSAATGRKPGRPRQQAPQQQQQQQQQEEQQLCSVPLIDLPESHWSGCVDALPPLHPGELRVLGITAHPAVARAYRAAHARWKQMLEDQIPIAERRKERHHVSLLCAADDAALLAAASSGSGRGGGAAAKAARGRLAEALQDLERYGLSEQQLRDGVLEYLKSCQVDFSSMELESLPKPPCRGLDVFEVPPTDPRAELRGSRAVRLSGSQIGAVAPGTVLGPYRCYVMEEGALAEAAARPPADSGWTANEWRLRLESYACDSHACQFGVPTHPRFPDPAQSDASLNLAMTAFGYGNVTALINDCILLPSNVPLSDMPDQREAFDQMPRMPGCGYNCHVFKVYVRGCPFWFMVSTATVRPGAELLYNYEGGYWCTQYAIKLRIENEQLKKTQTSQARSTERREDPSIAQHGGTQRPVGAQTAKGHPEGSAASHANAPPRADVRTGRAPSGGGDSPRGSNDAPTSALQQREERAGRSGGGGTNGGGAASGAAPGRHPIKLLPLDAAPTNVAESESGRSGREHRGRSPPPDADPRDRSRCDRSRSRSCSRRTGEPPRQERSRSRSRSLSPVRGRPRSRSRERDRAAHRPGGGGRGGLPRGRSRSRSRTPPRLYERRGNGHGWRPAGMHGRGPSYSPPPPDWRGAPPADWRGPPQEWRGGDWGWDHSHGRGRGRAPWGPPPGRGGGWGGSLSPRGRSRSRSRERFAHSPRGRGWAAGSPRGRGSMPRGGGRGGGGSPNAGGPGGRPSWHAPAEPVGRSADPRRDEPLPPLPQERGGAASAPGGPPPAGAPPPREAAAAPQRSGGASQGGGSGRSIREIGSDDDFDFGDTTDDDTDDGDLVLE